MSLRSRQGGNRFDHLNMFFTNNGSQVTDAENTSKSVTAYDDFQDGVKRMFADDRKKDAPQSLISRLNFFKNVF
jgi:hypothetical protein